MTIAMLLSNTLISAKRIHNFKKTCLMMFGGIILVLVIVIDILCAWIFQLLQERIVYSPQQYVESCNVRKDRTIDLFLDLIL